MYIIWPFDTFCVCVWATFKVLGSFKPISWNLGVGGEVGWRHKKQFKILPTSRLKGSVSRDDRSFRNRTQLGIRLILSLSRPDILKQFNSCDTAESIFLGFVDHFLRPKYSWSKKDFTWLHNLSCWLRGELIQIDSAVSCTAGCDPAVCEIRSNSSI